MTDPAAELETFVETLRADRLFEPGATVVVSRAPGRLDVMGGIADYSGSLVLQRTIAEATFAAVQRIDRPVVEVVSVGADAVHDSARDARAWRRADRLRHGEASICGRSRGGARGATTAALGVLHRWRDARARTRARAAAHLGREDRGGVAGTRG